MEKSSREDWLKTYNWTSLISAVGPVVAMLAGYVWLMEYSAQTYAIVCSAIAVSSLVLTVMFVQDPPATLKRRAMVRLPALLIYRFKHVPMMFLKPVSDLSVSKLRASVSKKRDPVLCRHRPVFPVRQPYVHPLYAIFERQRRHRLRSVPCLYDTAPVKGDLFAIQPRYSRKNAAKKG
jgi:hypothetical protein